MSRVRTAALLLAPVIIGHLLLPVSLLLRLWQTTYPNLFTWISAVSFAAGYFAFLYVAGAWSWFGRGCRYALPALLILAAVSRPGGEAPRGISASASMEPILRITLGSIFAAMTAFALLGRRAGAATLDLGFPLRGGTFHVAQGGASRVVNYHFSHPSQRYALDILALNRLGIRAYGIYPRQPERYAIWGAEVVSPCDGVVKAAVDEFQDLSPPDRDAQNRAGNYVAIELEGATIYLAHLMRGSLAVRAGDRVRTGQLLGRVGNSGNTTEPHLHVHAEKGAYSGRFSGMPAVRSASEEDSWFETTASRSRARVARAETLTFRPVCSLPPLGRASNP